MERNIYMLHLEQNFVSLVTCKPAEATFKTAWDQGRLALTVSDALITLPSDTKHNFLVT